MYIRNFSMIFFCKIAIIHSKVQKSNHNIDPSWLELNYVC
jgi:hypothetical protein